MLAFTLPQASPRFNICGRLISTHIASSQGITLDRLPRAQALKSLKFENTIDWYVKPQRPDGSKKTKEFLLIHRSPHFSITLLHRPVAPSKPNPTSLMATGSPRRTAFVLTVLTTKADIHPHAVIRNKVRTKIKEAIKLIVARGIRRSPDEPNALLADINDTGPERWLVQDYGYLIKPNISVFRLPTPDLIEALRAGLSDVKKIAEGKLAKANMTDQPAPRAGTVGKPFFKQKRITTQNHAKPQRAEKHRSAPLIPIGTTTGPESIVA